jgi:hypothetical protein
MASFRKRGELQWQARVAREGFPPQVKTFNTKPEAEAWQPQLNRRWLMAPSSAARSLNAQPSVTR